MTDQTQSLLPWHTIHTVLLDMDGTLLDLHYDNHFWLEYVPQQFAEMHDISLTQAKQEIYARYREVEGTLNWYCVDYWSDTLKMDIPVLKEEVDHLIAIHPHVIDFLNAVRKCGKEMVLVTNAHGKALDIKFRRTSLGNHFDRVVCSHDLRIPKEHREFWRRLQTVQTFEKETTLLVDDSLPVLQAAREYGIGHLLGVRRPDSKGPEKHLTGFRQIDSFRDIMPSAQD